MADAVYDEIGDKFEIAVNNTSERLVEINTFQKMVQNVSNKYVLDLACGSGFFSQLLIQMNAKKVVGVDISSEMIRLAREENKNTDRLSFEVYDILDMPNLGLFDMVTAVWLLCYAKDKKLLTTMFSKIFDSLKENGVFIGYTSNPNFRMSISNFTKYGLTITSETPIPGGLLCDAQFATTPPIPFQFYRLSREVYEAAARKAGFRNIQWVTPLIPQTAIEFYGNDYWNDYRENCDQIGIICRK